MKIMMLVENTTLMKVCKIEEEKEKSWICKAMVAGGLSRARK
jgi:hypothetical protein